MNGREWQPGDVAAFTFGTEEMVGVRVAHCRDGDHHTNVPHWHLSNGGWAQYNDRVRPLVVLDPEDREQVERLAREYVKTWLGPREGVSPETVEQMQAALREFANPTPPKPEAPTGWGAVVEDETGAYWTLFAPEADLWINHREGKRHYADIAAVRVLSEGVTA